MGGQRGRDLPPPSDQGESPGPSRNPTRIPVLRSGKAENFGVRFHLYFKKIGRKRDSWAFFRGPKRVGGERGETTPPPRSLNTLWGVPACLPSALGQSEIPFLSPEVGQIQPVFSFPGFGGTSARTHTNASPSVVEYCPHHLIEVACFDAFRRLLAKSHVSELPHASPLAWGPLDPEIT